MNEIIFGSFNAHFFEIHLSNPFKFDFSNAHCLFYTYSIHLFADLLFLIYFPLVYPVRIIILHIYFIIHKHTLVSKTTNNSRRTSRSYTRNIRTAQIEHCWKYKNSFASTRLTHIYTHAYIIYSSQRKQHSRVIYYMTAPSWVFSFIVSNRVSHKFATIHCTSSSCRDTSHIRAANANFSQKCFHICNFFFYLQIFNEYYEYVSIHI